VGRLRQRRRRRRGGGSRHRSFGGYLQRFSSFSPGFSVGVAPGGGSIPASSDGYGFSSAMTEILHPDPDQMQREKGFILREWRRRGTFLVDPIIRRFGIPLPLPLVGFEWPPGAMVRPPKAHAHDGHGGGGRRHRLGSINRRSDP
ncbi:unnamed protein product, partial [Musa hybrid cultivar]